MIWTESSRIWQHNLEDCDPAQDRFLKLFQNGFIVLGKLGHRNVFVLTTDRFDTWYQYFSDFLYWVLEPIVYTIDMFYEFWQTQ